MTTYDIELSEERHSIILLSQGMSEEEINKVCGDVSLGLTKEQVDVAIQWLEKEIKESYNSWEYVMFQNDLYDLIGESNDNTITSRL